jgi:non-ribosomal peptide synthetase-like protein
LRQPDYPRPSPHPERDGALRSPDVTRFEPDRASGSGAPGLGRFRLLHEFFEAQATARPDTIAVDEDGETTTYRALERRANRVANWLRAHGVERDSRVAMLLPRSADAYAAILGILKAGAAYVPLDPEHPADRTAYVLDDCGAAALVTTAALAGRHAAFAGTVLRMDADRHEIGEAGATRPPHDEVGAIPRDLCYVIYTSGTTGRPKGVMIEHRSACQFVRAEAEVFGVRPGDRVWQGFSLAFDASVEELWLAFCAGATLVRASPEMAHAGPDLARVMTESRITVLSCVPTLLSMVTDDVPSIRLLIVGGETCPDGLAARWARGSRRMVNTYGPTEATVVATWADLAPWKPVTIGRPLPGCRVHLLDDAMRPVARGETGEICIGGVGVARGYVGLHAETRARFVKDPLVAADEPGGRLYRTGDLGRVDAEGELVFVGRTDGQVQLRGFRVELAEIESALLGGEDVLAAACAVREDVPGVQQLVGYVVPRDGNGLDVESVRAHARTRLPEYMVPSLIETLPRLPRLPSGKLDRDALPAPNGRAAPQKEPAAPAESETERSIAKVWAELVHPRPVGRDDDFFLDLGGHSLLAARMVSELRKDARFAAVSVADVYAHPSVAKLASHLDTAPKATAPAPVRRLDDPHGAARHRVAGALQVIGLYFVYGVRAAHWIAPYLVLFLLLGKGASVLTAVAWAAAATVAMLPLITLTVVAAKWIVLGRLRPGRYPLWGATYLRWWFVHNLVAALPLAHLGGTPLAPFVNRLLGARIGRDVHLATNRIDSHDVISIGDGSSIDDQASIAGCAIEGGELVVAPVRVGRECFVGTRSVLSPGTSMGDGARLKDLTLLVRGTHVPAGETWAGAPARRSTRTSQVAQRPARTAAARVAIVALYCVLALVVPLVFLAALAPGIVILAQLDPLGQPLVFLVATPLVGLSFIVGVTTATVLAKWLLVGRARAGSYPVHGSFYMRNWVVEQLLDLTVEVAGALHATLYLAPWYRAFGARVGKLVELSTARSSTPDLVEIGDGGTVADEASLGAPRVETGWITIGPARLGRRAFVGNGGVVSAGTTMGDGSLVGVLSLSPADPAAAATRGATWLGSPPIRLPRRQASAAFDEARTYCPPTWLRLTRAVAEIPRVTLPPAMFVVAATTVITATLATWEHYGVLAALLAMPLVHLACCIGVLAFVAAAKWIVVGRYEPFERPLWTPFVWRLEFVNALYEFLAAPLALESLRGTPFLPWYLRLLGARIGRRTCICTTGFVEWDLVDVGDRATLDDDCVAQSHLFEDRVLKASRLRIGADCSVGEGSVVLYDTCMEDGSRLAALSLLMKGETLPAWTSWAGIPAARAGDRGDEAHSVS